MFPYRELDKQKKGKSKRANYILSNMRSNENSQKLKNLKKAEKNTNNNNKKKNKKRMIIQKKTNIFIYIFRLVFSFWLIYKIAIPQLRVSGLLLFAPEGAKEDGSSGKDHGRIDPLRHPCTPWRIRLRASTHCLADEQNGILIRFACRHRVCTRDIPMYIRIYIYIAYVYIYICIWYIYEHISGYFSFDEFSNFVLFYCFFLIMIFGLYFYFVHDVVLMYLYLYMHMFYGAQRRNKKKLHFYFYAQINIMRFLYSIYTTTQSKKKQKNHLQ